MTSNDRHASHDSPYRTGQHMPLNQSKHAPLTSVATSAIESRADINAPYGDQSPIPPTPDMRGGWPGSPGVGQEPHTPYSPGMRSESVNKRTSRERNPFDQVGAGEIQMQSFHDGAPPPPPVSHSWKKIDSWTEGHYEELFDQLSEGCTQNDVNELEHELDCSLPLEVRESLQVHDGQERGGMPTGIIFGSMLLDCEEIVQEWKNWKTVNEEFLSGSNYRQPQAPIKAFGGSSSSAAVPPAQAQNPLWKQELLDRQDSQPPRAIQSAYAHPAWIPLVRDWGGNNIAVDLAPGPMGKWGQVIIFGRDYDCKYVVARSWSAFLAVVADDLTSEKVFVDEETGELKLKEFKSANVEPGYFDILRWRADQKYGRKAPRRRSAAGLGVNTNVNGNGRINNDSPYGSPTPSVDGSDRGRSPRRGRTSSPKPGLGAATNPGVSSPLARVREEATVGGDVVRDFANRPSSPRNDNLVDLNTPRPSDERQKSLMEVMQSKTADVEADKENKKMEPAIKGLGVDGMDDVEGLKSVEI